MSLRHGAAVGLVFVVGSWGICSQTMAFSLASPVENVLLQPGQAIVAQVNLGRDMGVRLVRYYWYRLGEAPLVSQQAQAALEATASSSPPYGGRLAVPTDAIGTMRLLAVAEVSRGRLVGQDDFDEILVRVEPTAELLGIEFEVEKPWRLSTLGKVHEVPVVGQFADGVLRRLGGGSAGSAYKSSNEAVVATHPGGFLQVLGKGRAILTVSNRGREGRLEVVVDAEAEDNHAPIVHAGSDLEAKAGATVQLNALRSRDPDGDPLRYEWEQVRGQAVSLLDADSPKPTFVAPKVSARRLLQFKLRVTDMRGPDTVKGADSLPAHVNVWVSP